LVKEVEKKVYIERPVEKVVYKDKPEEHIREHLGGDTITQLRPAVDKLSTGDKANPPLTLALEEKKSTKGDTKAGWIGGGILLSIIVGGLFYKWLR